MSDEILSLKFEWDDFGALLKIMTVLRSIGERESSIETLFPSLKKIIYMLLQYSVRVPRKCSIQVDILLFLFVYFRVFFELFVPSRIQSDLAYYYSMVNTSLRERCFPKY